MELGPDELTVPSHAFNMDDKRLSASCLRAALRPREWITGWKAVCESLIEKRLAVAIPSLNLAPISQWRFVQHLLFHYQLLGLTM